MEFSEGESAAATMAARMNPVADGGNAVAMKVGSTSSPRAKGRPP